MDVFLFLNVFFNINIFKIFLNLFLILTHSKVCKCPHDDVNTHENFHILTIFLLPGVGRLVFGKMADLPRIKANGNRIILQQIAFLSIGKLRKLGWQKNFSLSVSERAPLITFTAMLFLMGVFRYARTTMH